MLNQAHAILANALDAEAHLQETGGGRQLGDAFDPTLAQVLETGSDADEAVDFGFAFWDEWVDAANHDWQFHDPLTERDWPRFAREVAAAVRQGRLPDNEVLVDQIRRKPRRTLRQWLGRLFGQ
jgi:hypothetical protein